MKDHLEFSLRPDGLLAVKATSRGGVIGRHNARQLAKFLDRYLNDRPERPFFKIGMNIQKRANVMADKADMVGEGP